MENKEALNNKRLAFLNEKQDEMAQRQENGLVLDFDQALKEAKHETLTIKLLKESFELPAEMPYSFSMFFLRHCYKKIKGKWVVIMPDDKMTQFLDLMFGQRFLNFLESSKNQNISINFVFKKIVPEILDKWGYGLEKDNSDNFSDQKKILTQES
jgi:hypothetical protein